VDLPHRRQRLLLGDGARPLLQAQPQAADADGAAADYDHLVPCARRLPYLSRQVWQDTIDAAHLHRGRRSIQAEWGCEGAAASRDGTETCAGIAGTIATMALTFALHVPDCLAQPREVADVETALVSPQKAGCPHLDHLRADMADAELR
jgi:hypothetical protein